MNKEELNQYVGFKEIFEYIKDQHLYAFPTYNDYIEDYLNIEDENIDEKILDNVKRLYQFLLDKDYVEYLSNLEIDFESSKFDSNNKIIKICFANIDDTNTEDGYEVNSVVYYVFEVDCEYDCFRSFSIED